MDIRLQLEPPVYRCVLDGAPSVHQLEGITHSLLPLLREDIPHLIVDARRSQVLHEPAIALLLAPMIRVFLVGGGVAVVGASPELQAALERLGMQARIPVVPSIEKAHEAILRMIPKRYSARFFQLLIEEGVATSVQIKDLHGEYKRHGGSIPFGTLLIKRGFLTVERLLTYLDKVEHPERYPTSGEDAGESVEIVPTPVATGGTSTIMGGRKSEFFEKRLLGEILIETSIITEEQLRKVLEDPLFKSGQVKVGDLLIQKGLVQPAQIFEALELQADRRGAGRSSGSPQDMNSEFVKRSLLGEILLERGFIQEKDLRLALDEQRTRPNARLGDILLQMGVIDTAQLLEALEYQGNRRG